MSVRCEYKKKRHTSWHIYKVKTTLSILSFVLTNVLNISKCTFSFMNCQYHQNLSMWVFKWEGPSFHQAFSTVILSARKPLCWWCSNHWLQHGGETSSYTTIHVHFQVSIYKYNQICCHKANAHHLAFISSYH